VKVSVARLAEYFEKGGPPGFGVWIKGGKIKPRNHKRRLYKCEVCSKFSEV